MASAPKKEKNLTGSEIAALAKRMPTLVGMDTKTVLVHLFKSLYNALDVPNSNPLLVRCMSLKYGLSRSSDISRVNQPLTYANETVQMIKTGINELGKMNKPSVQAHTKSYNTLKDAVDKLGLKRDELQQTYRMTQEDLESVIKNIIQRLNDAPNIDDLTRDQVIQNELSRVDKKLNVDLMYQVTYFIKELTNTEASAKTLFGYIVNEIPSEQRSAIGMSPADISTPRPGEG